jgi:hypothetical protein
VIWLASSGSLLTVVDAQTPLGGVSIYPEGSEWESTGFNNGRSIVRDGDGYYHAVFHRQPVGQPPTPGG